MNRLFFCLLFATACSGLMAQSFTYYLTGNPDDTVTATQSGTVLMGGATESDAAMVWFLERAGGGDVLVLRASGSDGYNNYFYEELGVDVHSVQTIVFNDASASEDPWVIEQVEHAEALWIAGGDQWNYVDYWKDTPIEAAINDLINVKKIPVGGTSAGMAIQGDAYFSAQNGTVSSADALSDPYDMAVTIGYHDFLENPMLERVITDTHFDNPDRKGRLITFLARLYTDEGILPLAIACEEYTAVCIDEMGVARVFGEYPDYDDFAYFIQLNCQNAEEAPVCNDTDPLHWQNGESALLVAKLAGTETGSESFNLDNWQSLAGTEHQWQYWWVEDGDFYTSDIDSADFCTGTTDIPLTSQANTYAYPNPAANMLQVVLPAGKYQIFNTLGEGVGYHYQRADKEMLFVGYLPNGIYLLTGASNAHLYFQVMHGR